MRVTYCSVTDRPRNLVLQSNPRLFGSWSRPRGWARPGAPGCVPRHRRRLSFYPWTAALGRFPAREKEWWPQTLPEEATFF